MIGQMQRLIQSGEGGLIDQINAQNAGAILQIEAQGVQDYELQELMESGMMSRLNAENASQMALLVQSRCK